MQFCASELKIWFRVPGDSCCVVCEGGDSTLRRRRTAALGHCSTERMTKSDGPSFRPITPRWTQGCSLLMGPNGANWDDIAQCICRAMACIISDGPELQPIEQGSRGALTGQGKLDPQR
jgi:hypothetical protein